MIKLALIDELATVTPRAAPSRVPLAELLRCPILSRGFLYQVNQVFLEHYVPRWEDVAEAPAGWSAKASPRREASTSGVH